MTVCVQTLISGGLENTRATLADVLPRTEKLTRSLIEHVLGDPGISFAAEGSVFFWSIVSYSCL